MISAEVFRPELLKEGDSWLKINNPEFRERLEGADILLADLDETDAPSPAKKIARQIVTKTLNLKSFAWLTQTVVAFLRNNQKAESGAWKNFLADFRQNKDFQKALREFTPQEALRVSYPGVLEFYNSLSCPKVYVSRNVSEVVSAFAQAFGFSQIFTEQFNKIEALPQIFQSYPDVKTIIVRGDSEEDGEVVRFLEKKGKNVVSVCVCKRLGRNGFPADILTSPNQTLLFKVLEAKK